MIRRNNFRKERNKRLIIEPFTEVQCNFRAGDLPEDIQIIQRRPPLPIYHLCWVDKLGERPIECKIRPVRGIQTPLDAIVFTGFLLEDVGQFFQAEYMIEHLKSQNRECYVRQRL
tara:strand:+ start:479 stop:823 length:345 start_codon:yes stop_codon:yes gene_type:complete